MLSWRMANACLCRREKPPGESRGQAIFRPARVGSKSRGIGAGEGHLDCSSGTSGSRCSGGFSRAGGASRKRQINGYRISGNLDHVFPVGQGGAADWGAYGDAAIGNLEPLGFRTIGKQRVRADGDEGNAGHPEEFRRANWPGCNWSASPSARIRNESVVEYPRYIQPGQYRAMISLVHDEKVQTSSVPISSAMKWICYFLAITFAPIFLEPVFCQSAQPDSNSASGEPATNESATRAIAPFADAEERRISIRETTDILLPLRPRDCRLFSFFDHRLRRRRLRGANCAFGAGRPAGR